MCMQTGVSGKTSGHNAEYAMFQFVVELSNEYRSHQSTYPITPDELVENKNQGIVDEQE